MKNESGALKKKMGRKAKTPFSFIDFQKRVIEEGGNPYTKYSSFNRLFTLYWFTELEEAVKRKVGQDKKRNRNEKAWQMYQVMGGIQNRPAFAFQFKKFNDVRKIIELEKNKTYYTKEYKENNIKLSYSYFIELRRKGFSVEEIKNWTYYKIIKKEEKKKKEEILTDRDKKRIKELLDWGLSVDDIVKNYWLGTKFLINKYIIWKYNT